MRVALYLRVSTDRQAEEGNGLDVQERLCRAWAKAHGHTVVEVCQDAGISGTKTAVDRPGLSKALDLVHSGAADGLLVRDLDRLARELTVQEALLADIWRRADSGVFTATSGEVLRDDPDDPMRRALRQVVGVFADLERAMVVKRMRDGRKAKAARGGYAVGAPPFGWTAQGGELVPHPEEQAVVRRIRKLHKTHSHRGIAVVLNAESLLTKQGRPWTHQSVSAVLARKPSAATRAQRSTPVAPFATPSLTPAHTRHKETTP
jgi:DNA invertase Pin-like site-specific DNA recombinase